MSALPPRRHFAAEGEGAPPTAMARSSSALTAVVTSGLVYTRRRCSPPLAPAALFRALSDEVRPFQTRRRGAALPSLLPRTAVAFSLSATAGDVISDDRVSASG